ncbi:MAG TPA: tetratricopeptide repeat protein [Myxococcota bacterium]|nr:tetratricopeptide repeat protein [Myxococcota bacterium]
MGAALQSVLDRDLDAAEQALVRAVQIDPDAVTPHLALGRLYRMRGEIGRAIRIHQNLLLRKDLERGQRRTLLADLGSDFRQGGFAQRAVACFEDALAEDKRDVAALQALVELHAQAGQPERALECQRRLAKLTRSERGGREALLYVELARAEHANGRHDEALRAAKRALRADRRCAAAWLLVGDLEAERGRAKAALAAWCEAPRADRASGAGVYARLEATYATLGRAREFETYLLRLLDEQPDDARARRALATALAARGGIDEGIGHLNQLLARNPDDLGARAALGRILLSDGRLEDAAREFEQLMAALDRLGLTGSAEKPE